MSRTSRKTDLAKDETAGPFGYVTPPDLLIEIPGFQGSLATLFTCVRERKIDLLGVPLFPICQSYLEYILTQPDPDIEGAAAALTALSYLLERKAWSLIPKPEEPEPEADDFLEEIIPTIGEFAPAIEALRGLQEERSKVYFRQTDGADSPYELPFEFGDVTVIDLAVALERLMAKAKPDRVEPMGRPRRSLADQMTHVLMVLTDEPRPLDQIMDEEFTRSQVVWWFLSLLELIRLGQAGVKMEEGEAMFWRRRGE